jgi:hypothetical protein
VPPSFHAGHRVRRGSVPEVVEHGVTGFIVEDEEEVLQTIRRLQELDRSRFTARRMAEEHVHHYRLLLETRRLGWPWPNQPMTQSP